MTALDDNFFQLQRIPNLSNTTMEIDTYYFTYPAVDDLLQLLDTVLGDDGRHFIDDRGRQGLRIAGLTNIDDFVLISPVDLCLVSRIWPEKVNLLFAFAKDMIDDVHFEERRVIREVEDIRSIFRAHR